MGDSARSLRNRYYTGHYASVIEDGADSSLEGKVYYYRALLETNPAKVLSEVSDQSPTSHQAVRLLGTYRQASQDNKEMVFESIEEWLNDDILKDDVTLQVIAAQMYFEDGNYKDSLRLLVNPGENIEKLAMQVQVFIKMDRLDLAAKAAKAMGDIDDDDPLAQLATAWLYVCQGGDKTTEASFLFQELVDKFGPSNNMLVSLAVCQIHLGNHSEAFGHLKEARKMALSANQKANTETLVNSMCCMMHMNKNEIVPKVMSELQELRTTSASDFLLKQDKLGEMFDHHAKGYSV